MPEFSIAQDLCLDTVKSCCLDSSKKVPCLASLIYVVLCAMLHTFQSCNIFLLSCIDLLVLSCSSHVTNVVGPKAMVVDSYVYFPSISGSSMRLDISPALMFSCQFSKLVEEYLVVCHKTGTFDSGAIFLCNSVRGSLCHLFQWVIPVSFFPFLGCGVFPDDVCKRDTGYPTALAKEIINSIKSL